MDWDDLRFVLAISRAGSLSGAGRSLGVDQTTVGRRLSTLEKQLNAALFLRSRSGFFLTEAGEEVVVHAEVIETAAMALAENVHGQLKKPTGMVRIASMPWIFNYLLVPALPSFVRRYPRVEIQGIADLRERSLSNREAELALRFEMQPHGKERSFEIATVPYAVYAPKGADTKALPWIGSAVDSGLYQPEKWLNEIVEDGTEHLSFRSDDAGILYQAVCAGVGKGLLPEILAEDDAALIRLSGSEPEMVRRLRVLVHPDVERFARVEAVIEWLRETLAVTC
jgi:DNA-binding transcriptional LysR family regulator